MNSNRGFFYNLSKYSTILMTVMVGLTLSGCFTYGMINEGLTSQSHRLSEAVLSDTLLAIGKPDAATSKLLGVPDALALAGAKNTYVLTKGGDKLSELAQLFQSNPTLDAERLVLIDDSNKSAKRLFLDNETAWGIVEFNYEPVANGTYTQNERQTLEKIGFTIGKDTLGRDSYELLINIAAAIKPAIKLSNANIPSFKKNRTLTFYEPDSKTLVTKPKVGKILLLPFSVAADVATSPIQLLGFGAFVLALANAD